MSSDRGRPGPLAIRVFISVDMDPTEKLMEMQEILSSSGADLRIVPPENLHVTLQFLGDVDEGKIPLLKEILTKIASKYRPAELSLRGLGAFPSNSYIKVVWVGMEGAGSLTDISRELGGEIARLGLKTDRKGFRPHLTLARVRSAQNIGGLKDMLARNDPWELGGQTVMELKLKRSVLTPGGPVYSDLEVARLGQL